MYNWQLDDTIPQHEISFQLPKNCDYMAGTWVKASRTFYLSECWKISAAKWVSKKGTMTRKNIKWISTERTVAQKEKNGWRKYAQNHGRKLWKYRQTTFASFFRRLSILQAAVCFDESVYSTEILQQIYFSRNIWNGEQELLLGKRRNLVIYFPLSSWPKNITNIIKTFPILIPSAATVNLGCLMLVNYTVMSLDLFVMLNHCTDLYQYV